MQATSLRYMPGSLRHDGPFVRVVRVRYPARSSGAIHTHPAPGALIVPDVGLERLVVRHTLSSLT